MSGSDASLSALTSAQSSWETVGFFLSACVAAGCLGELLHDLKVGLGLSHFWRSYGGKASYVLLVVALALEIPAQIVLASVNSRINAVTVAKLANLAGMVKLEEETASALIGELSPRMLDIASLDRVLAPYKGVHVFVAVIDEDEAKGLARALWNALINAGWSPNSITWVGASKFTQPGLSVAARYAMYSGFVNKAAGDMATAMCEELDRQGLRVFMVPDFLSPEPDSDESSDPNWNPKVPNDALLVQIGRKESHDFFGQWANHLWETPEGVQTLLSLLRGGPKPVRCRT